MEEDLRTQEVIRIAGLEMNRLMDVWITYSCTVSEIPREGEDEKEKREA